MNRPQLRARLITVLTATTGDNTVTIRVYEANASHGTRLTRWVTYHRDGRLVKSEAYSGRRLAALDAEVQELRDQAESWGATVTVEHPSERITYRDVLHGVRYIVTAELPPCEVTT